MIILSNISRIEEGRAALLQIGTEFEGVYLYQLIQRYCIALSASAAPKEDRYQWVAPILTNITQVNYFYK